MKKILFFILVILVSNSLFASEKQVRPITHLSKLIYELSDCYTSFWSNGHFIELYVVYEGDRCNTISQAAGLYMDGKLVEANDCTDYAVDFACGPVNCI